MTFRSSSTGRYDGSFFNAFVYSLDFNYPIDRELGIPDDAREKIEWWCLNGGTDILAKKMAGFLNKSVQMKTRVTAIRKTENPVNSDRPMQIFTDRSTEGAEFSHVITTTTTSCLQAIDLHEAHLLDAQKEAIRVLRYNNAVKLGIKFSKKWWMRSDIDITAGGQGRTDRLTHIVVYPSYALDQKMDEEGVLLACYNSSGDATRLGGFIQEGGPRNQKLILDIVLHDLALMHEIEYEELIELVVDHHFYDWSRDEFTAGAWGSFEPGQFGNFFGCLQLPAAGGNLLFAGELSSIYHGWIVAALNSAYKAVHLMLYHRGQSGLLRDMGIEPDSAEDNITAWKHEIARIKEHWAKGDGA